MSREVTLTGHLICEDAEQAQRIAEALPAHVALTRTEPGCLAFEVLRGDDPRTFTVAERFADPAAFAAHQKRSAASDWALISAGITRDYEITGLP
ncbi:putative quinol monooxygenase [Sulfitobacter aestuarii]|uniref:Quinol monooxygenase n=1 Tax=Sulfitobacter aestuarii TaxID=2161676 RepID=A0ABW5U2S6_9RHOB